MPSQKTSLTVAVPTYNRAQTVSKLAQSILTQLKPEEELLVIDDGSGDATSDLLGAIPGVRLHRQTPNQGMVKSWNACLELASNDWICMIHDDDTLCAGALPAIRSACRAAGEPALILHKPAPQEAACDFRCQTYPAGPAAVFCAASGTVPSGAVVHRDIIQALGGFDPQFFYSTDIEFFARISARYPLIVIESPAIVVYELHGDNYQYRTWLKEDFFPQLLEIERRVIAYAGLEGVDAARMLRERILAYLIYIANQACQIKNRSLMRKFGFLLWNNPWYGKRTRLRGLTTALRSWLPLHSLAHRDAAPCKS